MQRWCDRLAEDGEGWRARRRPLFYDGMEIIKRWVELADVLDDHYDGLGSSHLAQAIREIDDACRSAAGTDDRLVAAFSYPQLLDTSGIRFETSLEDRYDTTNSELNIAACHSRLEVACAKLLDEHPDVTAWARNFRLGWTVPYLWDGTWRRYEPDFVARLFGEHEDDVVVHLIVECKGVPDPQSERKKQSVVESWIPAVQESVQLPRWLRRWSFVELASYPRLAAELNQAIRDARTARPSSLLEKAA